MCDVFVRLTCLIKVLTPLLLKLVWKSLIKAATNSKLMIPLSSYIHMHVHMLYTCMYMYNIIIQC